MNELVLWLPAIILPLFCLIYSIAARRELYFPFPKGISAKLRNQHVLFLAMLCAVIMAAAARISETVSGMESPGLIHAVGVVFRIILFCFFVIYTLALPETD